MRPALLLLTLCVLLAGCAGPVEDGSPDNGSIEGAVNGTDLPGGGVAAAPNPVCTIDAEVGWTNVTTVTVGGPDAESEVTVEQIAVTVGDVGIADVERNRLNNFTDPSECRVASGQELTAIIRDPSAADVERGDSITAHAHLEGDEWFHGIFLSNITVS